MTTATVQSKDIGRAGAVGWTAPAGFLHGKPLAAARTVGDPRWRDGTRLNAPELHTCMVGVRQVDVRLSGCGCEHSLYWERLLTGAFMTAAAAWGGKADG